MFVYPEFTPHRPYRELTRTKSLTSDSAGVLEYELHGIPATLVFPEGSPQFVNDQAEIDRYFSYWGTGVNLTHYMNSPGRGFVSEGYRAERHCHDSKFPRAIEIITYGIGLLQYRKAHIGGFYHMLGADIPRLAPRARRVHMTHLVTMPQPFETDVLDSTNIILADSYGELEQLRERRQDMTFIDTYLDYLRWSASQDSFFMRSQNAIMPAWRRHVSIGLWKEPPTNPAELSGRVDFILRNTEIDHDTNIRYEMIQPCLEKTNS